LVKFNQMNISQSLVELRKSTGLRQTEAANRIGISQTYLSQIENGAKEPSTGILQDICKVYGIPAPIMYFKALTINDVPKNKRKAFAELKPLIDKLINEIF